MLKSQQELNFSQYTDLYDKLIPQNHLFRKINELSNYSAPKIQGIKQGFQQRQVLQLQRRLFHVFLLSRYKNGF